MNKEEIKNQLISSGLIHRFKLHPLWMQAFSLFNEEKNGHLKPSCGSCYKKVKEWLLT